MKLSGIIVDDELPARENLRILIEDYCPEINIIGTAGSVAEAQALIGEKSPEVVFLDIRMPAGMEGFDLLASLPEINFQVIFVTAFKEFAVQAFNANAIHYILKPIDIVELKKAVNKLVQRSTQYKNSSGDFEQYLHSLENLQRNLIRENPGQNITINHSKGFKIIHDEDIIHLEADGNYTMLYLKEGKTYLDTRTLKVYEDFLDAGRFLRVHKSHIVNLTHVSEYLNEDGQFVIMNNGSSLPISRNKLQLFFQMVKGS